MISKIVKSQLKNLKINNANILKESDLNMYLTCSSRVLKFAYHSLLTKRFDVTNILSLQPLFKIMTVFFYLIFVLLCAIEAKEEKKMRFFALDFHGSVSRDIKYIIEELGHEVVIWMMPGSPYSSIVFGKTPDSIEVFTFQDWISKPTLQMYDQFFEKYKDFLSEFDCFIAPLNAAMAPIYEKTGKPVIAMNASRYELPFTVHPQYWSWLNEFLIRKIQENKLFLIANNKGDQEYLRYYTGIHSEHIPSLCLYPGCCYSREKSTFICNPQNRYTSLSEHIQKQYPTLINPPLPSPYSWKDLYSYRGIIHFPYQISTMSLFEQYSANIPLFFPSKEFLVKLRENHPEILSECSYYHSLYNANEDQLPSDDLNCLSNPNVIQFWIDHADFYDKKNMPYIQYFHSFDHLKELLLIVDTKTISHQMKQHNIKRKELIFKKWEKLLKRVEAACKKQ